MRFLALSICFLLPAATGFAQQSLSDYDYNFWYFEPEEPARITPELNELTPRDFQSHPEYGKKPWNAQCSDCSELIQKRTADSRYFIKNGTGGKVFYVQKSYGPMHYLNHAGQWITIDPHLRPVPGQSGVFAAPNQPVPVKIDLNRGYTAMVLQDGHEFRFNQDTQLYFEWETGRKDFGPADLSSYHAGTDGLVNVSAWDGIYRRELVQQGEVETDYIISKPLKLPAGQGWLVWEETLEVPAGYTLEKDSSNGFYTMDDTWNGDLLLRDSHRKTWLTIKAPDLRDSLFDHGPNHIGYELIRADARHYRFRLKVNTAWMNEPDRAYPVTVDPLVIGTDTFSSGNMGFRFNTTCYNLTNYCPYTLVVTVPGKSTLTNAYFDARFVSKINGCGFNANCIKKEAWFRIVGPCGTSPSATGYWSCTTPPQSDLPGTCYGDTIPMFNTINCLPPSCPDHVISFEMRNAHCSCNLTGCDTACHVMRIGTWRITIEARTIESNVTGSTSVCLGDSATLTAFGYWGVPPYTYSWAPGGQTTKSITVSPSSTTTYTCTVTDTCGESSQSTGTITVNPLPVLFLSAVNAFCTGGSDGSATVSVSGGLPPYTYEWDTNPLQFTPTATNLSSGWYKVIVTDANGCISRDSVFVGVDNVLALSATPHNATCPGAGDGWIDLNVDTGQPPYTFNWSNGATVEDPQNLGPGTYTVTVTDNLGCVNTLTVTVAEDPAVVIDAGTQQVIIIGSSVNLNVNVSPPGSYTYTWSPPTGLDNPNSPSPVATPDTTTTYTVVVVSTKNAGCADTDTVTIIVLPDLDLPVPNAFSPNGDGRNDVFFVPSGPYEILRLQIFNRWGELLYDGTGPWDGTLNGKPQPVGTYAFTLTIRFPLNNEEVQKKGNVTLLR